MQHLLVDDDHQAGIVLIQRDLQHGNVQIVVDQYDCAISITASNRSPLLGKVDGQTSIVAT